MAYPETRKHSNSPALPPEFRRAIANADYSIIAPRNPILLPQKEGVAASSSSQRRATTHRRKARILATARQLIAEESYDQVVMRRLAERSEVSIPTIYNLIGGRDEVLQLATSEALQANIVFATARSELERINPILAFIDTVWMCLAHDPEYSRQVMRGIFYRNIEAGGGHLFEEIEATFEKWLNQLKLAGNYRGTGVGTRTLAKLITQQSAAAVAFWMNDGTGTDELRRDMAQGAGLLLLGVVANEEAARVANWLKRLA